MGLGAVFNGDTLTIPQISARMGIINRESGHIFNNSLSHPTMQDAGNKG